MLLFYLYNMQCPATNVINTLADNSATENIHHGMTIADSPEDRERAHRKHVIIHEKRRQKRGEKVDFTSAFSTIAFDQTVVRDQGKWRELDERSTRANLHEADV